MIAYSHHPCRTSCYSRCRKLGSRFYKGYDTLPTTMRAHSQSLLIITDAIFTRFLYRNYITNTTLSSLFIHAKYIVIESNVHLLVSVSHVSVECMWSFFAGLRNGYWYEFQSWLYSLSDRWVNESPKSGKLARSMLLAKTLH